MSETEKFVREFESLSRPLAKFKHVDHVHLAWAYLTRMELPEALARFRDSLKKFAAFHDKGQLYHETITFAFMILIHERMRTQDHTRWSAFAAQNQDLIQNGKEVLARYYKPETLFSAEAKIYFRMPDVST